MFARRALVSALAPIIFISACTSSSESQAQTTIEVYAASSLATPFAYAGLAFEKNTGVKVQFNLGASSDLARFVQEGAPADVFESKVTPVDGSRNDTLTETVAPLSSGLTSG